MLINGVEPEKPTPYMGMIIICGGPRIDVDRDKFFACGYDKSYNEYVKLMSINHTHKNVRDGIKWDYHVCNESLDPTKFDIPIESHSIGLYCGKQSHPRIDQIIELDHNQGGAGLLGVIAAVYMGYSPVLTVGLYVNKPPYDGARSEWEHWKPYLDGHVKSLNTEGLVAELFGVME